jgi:hypothetical protein
MNEGSRVAPVQDGAAYHHPERRRFGESASRAERRLTIEHPAVVPMGRALSHRGSELHARRDAITTTAGEVFGAARRLACIRADEVRAIGGDALPRKALGICTAFGAVALACVAPRVIVLAKRKARALFPASAEMGLDIPELPVRRARDVRIVRKVGDKVRVVASEVYAVFQPRPGLGTRPQFVADDDVLVLVEAR